MLGLKVTLAKSLNLKMLNFLNFTLFDFSSCYFKWISILHQSRTFCSESECQFKTQQPLDCVKLQRKTLQAAVKEENFFVRLTSDFVTSHTTAFPRKLPQPIIKPLLMTLN